VANRAQRRWSGRSRRASVPEPARSSRERRPKKAKAAALAAYPGGTVNRVVRLSDGEYNVHVIAVNWPHHVFVNKEYKVTGAE